MNFKNNQKIQMKLLFEIELMVLFLLIGFSLTAQKVNTKYQPTNECGLDKINKLSFLQKSVCPLFNSCYDPLTRDDYMYDPAQPVKVVKTYVRILRETDGSNPAATERDIAVQFHHLNREFAPIGIQFTYIFDYIDDSSIRTVNTIPEQMDIMATHLNQSSEYCNIFVGSGPESFGYLPWMTEGSHGIFINEAPQFYPANNRSTLTHEMGHSLGLLHPFWGYSEIPCSHDCAENMGITGDDVGDKCSDTPPQERSTNPGFTQTTDNCNGLPFDSISHINYMSYSQSKLEFTPQQIALMHCFLETHPNRTGWIDDTNPEIPYVNEDNFGYSFEETPMNPADWIDINTIGTEITGLLDDNVVGPFDIGFNTEFYGIQYSEIYIGSNGYIAFSPLQFNTVSSLFPSIPTAEGKDGYFAPFLADLNFNGPGNPAKVYMFSNQSDSLIVTYEHVPFYNQTTGYTSSNTFQMVFTPENIIFQYLEMDNYYPPYYWFTVKPSLIGMESPDGLDGLEVNNYQIPADNTKVIISMEQATEIVDNIAPTNAYSVYPNPSNGIITFSLNRLEEVELIIINSIGQRIRQVEFSKEYTWYSRNDGISAGIYFFCIKTKNGQQSGKIILI